MWERRTVTLTVELPSDIADQAEELQRTDPELLTRVVAYGLMRRNVFRALQDQMSEAVSRR